MFILKQHLNNFQIETDFFQNAIWFWIVVLETIILLFLFYRLYKVKKENKVTLDFSNLEKEKINTAKKASVDMDNLMDSIYKSKNLYKLLSSKCHPDRFVNTDKIEIANSIFQEITKHKRDYNKLIILKKRAQKELNINF